MRKNLIALAVAALLLTCLALSTTASGAPLLQGVPTPEQITVTTGEIVSAIVPVYPGDTPIDHGEVNLKFDPAYLQVTQIADGSLTNTLESKYDNTVGTVSYSASGQAWTQPFELAEIALKAIKPTDKTCIDYSTSAFSNGGAPVSMAPVSGCVMITSAEATSTLTPTPANTGTPEPTQTSTSTPTTDVQPTLPLRAAFYYPWFPEAWTQGGLYPYTKYHPTLGFYNLADVNVIKQQIAAMQYGNIKAGIASWWGQGTPTDKRISSLLSAAVGTPFRWAVYYEAESTGDPTVSAIMADLTYLRDHYGNDPNFLRIDGRFVVFVFADGTDGCEMADRWKQANTVNAYVVLKVFGGYASCASQPDGWHQYGPAVATDRQGSYSYTISPGFYKAGEASPRLARDLTRWRQNIRDMIASGARFQLVTTFNEWGEGTSVESAQEWVSASGYGQYLDALHENGTTGPTPTPGSSNTPTSTKTPAPPTNTPVATKTPTNQPPSRCTPVALTKGPVLVLTGQNTQMKLAWQWTASAPFTVKWGIDTSYGKSASITSASALYAYTIGGLTPGTRYYYQVQTGSQCASGSFLAPPAASATGVKFVAYGDTRTNGNMHNTIAGQVDALFKSDPAFQTLNLNVGDWVSSDSETAWANEWFRPTYTNIRLQDASLADTGVRGNHEGAGTYWKRYFPQPFQPGGQYRSFDYGPMHVALVDQYVSYSVGSAQYNWLRADLAASTKTWKFVVLHEPGWSAGGGHANNATVQKTLQPLFKQYGVSIVFGGHIHYYARAVVDGVQHLTLGTGGAPLYTPASGQPNVVTAKQSYGYGQFTISGNQLTAKIVSNTGSVLDSFTVTR